MSIPHHHNHHPVRDCKHLTLDLKNPSGHRLVFYLSCYFLSSLSQTQGFVFPYPHAPALKFYSMILPKNSANLALGQKNADNTLLSVKTAPPSAYSGLSLRTRRKTGNLGFPFFVNP